MPEFFLVHQAMDPDTLSGVRDGLLSSPYVSDSPLASSFVQSRGFGIIFTRDGLPELRRRFEYLTPYLDIVLARGAAHRLLPWPLRPFAHRLAPVPNAFYLNVLLLGAGAGVGMHVEGTLRRISQMPAATPRFASVLYLRTPTPGSGGGQLRIFRRRRLLGMTYLGTVEPTPGLLIYFRGDLSHEVLPVQESGAGVLRASLVCEQYYFSPDALERIPHFRVSTRAGFASRLSRHRHQVESLPS